jgi:secreted trypsin-like serine protease
MIRKLVVFLTSTLVIFSLPGFASNELSTNIVNGTETSTTVYDDFVSLFYDRLDYDGVYASHSLCGGTMLTEQYVLTAAHCIFDGSGNPYKEYMLFMSVGQVDDESNFPDNVETVRAAEFYYDSTFSDSSSDLWENDIAIIKLASPLNVSGTVNRTSDETTYRDSTNSFVIVGHGNTETTEMTYKLLKASTTYVSNDSCKNSSSVLSGLHDSQLCFTGDSATSGSTSLRNGICRGDSGGPVYWNHNGTYVQVGVTSFGPTSCGKGLGTANITGVYTELADYDDWITQVLNGEIEPNYTATDAKRTAYYNENFSD